MLYVNVGKVLARPPSSRICSTYFCVLCCYLRVNKVENMLFDIVLQQLGHSRLPMPGGFCL